MSYYLITGANRGIGLGLCQELLKLGHNVYGACRNPQGERDLWELESDYEGRFHLLEMDITDEGSVQRACEKIEKLDIIFNNAGVLSEFQEGLESLNFDRVMDSFAVNSVGALKVVKHCLPHLRQSSQPKVFSISSELGSISGNATGKAYAYRASKAALNCFNKSLSLEFPKICFCVVHPGWVRTRMGGEEAPLSIHDSVEGLYRLSRDLGLEQSGAFFNYQGEELPW